MSSSVVFPSSVWIVGCMYGNSDVPGTSSTTLAKGLAQLFAAHAQWQAISE